MRLIAAAFLCTTVLVAQTTTTDTLTADGLRAWLNAGGALESNARLIHTQMQQQRAQLPLWWPDDVYTQEEDAIQKVDFVDAALPFYQACFTDREARVLAKMALTAAGQAASKAALTTHSQEAMQGASPMTAQVAGEKAVDKYAVSASAEDRKKFAAELTPAERAFAAKNFTVERAAATRVCANDAFAKTVTVMGGRQEAALRAVIDANRANLDAVRTQWEKDHPAKP
jgi:hypothetical protein